MSAAAWIAGFAAGTLGAMGLGGGSVLILYLTLWAGLEQTQAQGINLTFFLPCAAVAVGLLARKKQIDWRSWLYAAPAGIAGAVGGVLLAQVFGTELLRKIFAGFLLVFGLMELLHRKNPAPPAPRTFSGRLPHKYERERSLPERGDAPSNGLQQKDGKRHHFFARRR